MNEPVVISDNTALVIAVFELQNPDKHRRNNAKEKQGESPKQNIHTAPTPLEDDDDDKEMNE